MFLQTMVRASVAVAAVLGYFSTAAHAQQEPCIGNSSATTGPAAFGGQSIKMGAEIAIDEINAKGGVLGKPLRFVQYDDAGAPPRGVDNTRRIALADKCIAILGGYHSTVAVAQSAFPTSAFSLPIPRRSKTGKIQTSCFACPQRTNGWLASWSSKP
jgi:branched-chain amino acid transport system substrate-binding protein